MRSAVRRGEDRSRAKCACSRVTDAKGCYRLAALLGHLVIAFILYSPAYYVRDLFVAADVTALEGLQNINMRACVFWVGVEQLL